MDVQFWDFTTGLLIHELNWFPETVPTGIRYHQSSDLVAISCDDSTIRVVDVETKKLVREFHGSEGKIIDFVSS